MNEEQITLAHRLVAHPRWEWRDGIRLLNNGHDRGRLIMPPGPDWTEKQGRNFYPDLTDTGTAGVLLGMLENQALWLEWAPSAMPDYGCTVTVYGQPGQAGATPGEACARALLELWGPA